MRVAIIIGRNFRGASGDNEIRYDVRRGTLQRGATNVRCDAPVRLLFLALAARAPAIILYDELIDLLWADDPDGGPEFARGMISGYAQELRAAGASLGVRITTIHGRGLSANLLPREVAA